MGKVRGEGRVKVPGDVKAEGLAHSFVTKSNTSIVMSENATRYLSLKLTAM